MKINLDGWIKKFKKQQPESEVQEQYVLSDLKGPKLLFKGNTELFLGQWLDILQSLPYASKEQITAYKSTITNEQRNRIVATFRQLLVQMGISESETCVLSSINDDKYYMTLHLNNSNQDICAHYANDGDGMPEFRFSSNEEYLSYFYYDRRYFHDCETFKLYTHDILVGNGMHYKRRLSEYDANIELRNNNQKLSLEIERPKSNGMPHEDQFILPNEDALKDFISSLTFPMNITEIYQEICKILLPDNIKQYPKFSLKISDCRDNNVTDLISLSNGNVNTFINTQNNATVEFKNSENWSYKTPQYNTESSKGKITYSASPMPIDDISNFNPQTQVSEALREIEATKKMMKTLFEASN